MWTHKHKNSHTGAGQGGSRLYSQNFGRPRRGDNLRSGVPDQPGQHGETPSLLKNTKISQMWWRMPVIPATQEVEAGESFEPGRQRLQWAKITPLHSSLGNRVRLRLQKTKKKGVEFYFAFLLLIEYIWHRHQESLSGHISAQWTEY